MLKLQDAIDLFDDSSDFTFAVNHGDRLVDVKFQDDYGLGGRDVASFFLAGFENGPQMLIHARSFEAAWEAWIDELPTIPESEIPEAYGMCDEFRDEYEKTDPCPPFRGGAVGEGYDAWQARFHAAAIKELREREDAGEEVRLEEGYEYQSNASGTGIVDVGHYAWMNEIDASDIVVRRNGEELPEEPYPYTLAQVRQGTGWREGIRFHAVPEVTCKRCKDLPAVMRPCAVCRHVEETKPAAK